MRIRRGQRRLRLRLPRATDASLPSSSGPAAKPAGRAIFVTSPIGFGGGAASMGRHSGAGWDVRRLLQRKR